MDDFESIIDSCLEDIAAGRETVDSCLQRYPGQAARLAPVLAVAERLREMPAAPSMPVDQRRVLESRYLKRAAQVYSRAARRAAVPQRGMRRRAWMAVLAAFGVCLISITGIASASGSVPGDVLYPVKRATEQVRLALTSESQQAAVHLNLAQERLVEFRALAARHEVPANLLAEISAETSLVVQHIPSLPPEQQQALLTHLTEFNDQNLQVLHSVAAFAPGDTQVSVQAALADATTKQDQAKEMLASINVLPDAPPDGEQGPPLTPAGGENPPTLVEASTPEPAIQPQVTAEPQAQPTPQATQIAPDSPKPTPKIEHTPPGQSDKAKPTRQPHEQPTKKPPKK